MLEHSIDDLPSSVEVEPVEVAREAGQMLRISYMKRIAGEMAHAWTPSLEETYRASMSALVSACSARNIETLRFVYVDPLGKKTSRELPVSAFAARLGRVGINDDSGAG